MPYAVLALGERSTHRDAGHHLDAGGDHDVVRAADHALRGEVRRLLRRPALTVDRGRRHCLGEAGREHCVATDVRRLLADLHDAAHDHVFDQLGIELVALDQRLQRLSCEIDGMPLAELAVALAPCGADGIDDHCSAHWRIPSD
jgi:hypothetical protein